MAATASLPLRKLTDSGGRYGRCQQHHECAEVKPHDLGLALADIGTQDAGERGQGPRVSTDGGRPVRRPVE